MKFKSVKIVGIDIGKHTMVLSWIIPEFGFGTTTYWFGGDKIEVDTETLNKDSIKQILDAFVEKLLAAEVIG